MPSLLKRVIYLLSVHVILEPGFEIICPDFELFNAACAIDIHGKGTALFFEMIVNGTMKSRKQPPSPLRRLLFSHAAPPTTDPKLWARRINSDGGDNSGSFRGDHYGDGGDGEVGGREQSGGAPVSCAPGSQQTRVREGGAHQ